MKIVNLMLLSLLCGVIALPSVDVNAGIFGKEEAGKKHGGQESRNVKLKPRRPNYRGSSGWCDTKAFPDPTEEIKISALFGAVFSCAQLRV